MLVKLLENLEELLDEFEYKFSENQIKELKRVLEYYSGGIIPLGAFRRKMKVDMSVINELSIYLEEKGILESMLKVCCKNHTNEIREELYSDIRKIPRKVCDKCSEGCLYYENIVVVFKVVD